MRPLHSIPWPHGAKSFISNPQSGNCSQETSATSAKKAPLCCHMQGGTSTGRYWPRGLPWEMNPNHNPSYLSYFNTSRRRLHLDSTRDPLWCPKRQVCSMAQDWAQGADCQFTLDASNNSTTWTWPQRQFSGTWVNLPKPRIIRQKRVCVCVYLSVCLMCPSYCMYRLYNTHITIHMRSYEYIGW